MKTHHVLYNCNNLLLPLCPSKPLSLCLVVWFWVILPLCALLLTEHSSLAGLWGSLALVCPVTSFAAPSAYCVVPASVTVVSPPTTQLTYHCASTLGCCVSDFSACLACYRVLVARSRWWVRSSLWAIHGYVPWVLALEADLPPSGVGASTSNVTLLVTSVACQRGIPWPSIYWRLLPRLLIVYTRSRSLPWAHPCAVPPFLTLVVLLLLLPFLNLFPELSYLLPELSVGHITPPRLTFPANRTCLLIAGAICHRGVLDVTLLTDGGGGSFIFHA